MPLPEQTPGKDLDQAKPPLLAYARKLFAGLDIQDETSIRVFDSLDDGRRRFLDWSMTGTQSTDPNLTFMGFRTDLGPDPETHAAIPPREVTLRIFTILPFAPLTASLDVSPLPESRWDQLSALAQIGVRAVGRPVRGPLSLLSPDDYDAAAARYGPAPAKTTPAASVVDPGGDPPPKNAPPPPVN